MRWLLLSVLACCAGAPTPPTSGPAPTPTPAHAETTTPAHSASWRDFATLAPVVGSVRVEEDAWTVSLDLGRPLRLVVTEPPQDCRPSSWVLEPDDDVVVELDGVLEVLRVDLGDVEGAKAWLRLAPSEVHVVWEQADCTRAVEVSDALAHVPEGQRDVEMFLNLELTDRGWTAGSITGERHNEPPPPFGSLRARVVGPRIELLDLDGNVVVTPGTVFPREVRPWDCVELSMRGSFNEDDTLVHVEWHCDHLAGCDDGKDVGRGGQYWENWVRTDSGFRLHWASAPDPHTRQQTWVGTDLELRRTVTESKYEENVEMPGDGCTPTDHLSTRVAWEVRSLDGVWHMLGNANENVRITYVCGYYDP